MDYQDIKVRQQNKVAWIYFNRPESMNAMTHNMVRELRHAFEAVQNDDEVSVVVLSGVGRAFCAGADLHSALPAADDDPRAPSFLDEATAMENALIAITKPVIAAVNGVCCAGGFEMALMCDFIVANEKAKMGDAHANYGAMPGGGTTARLARLVGTSLAKYIFFTGDLLPASNFVNWGLVVKTTAPEGLEAEVQELAERIAKKSPLGLRHMKQLINAAPDNTLSAMVRTEKLTSTVYMNSYDAKEGQAAFAEKRVPVFLGY